LELIKGRERVSNKITSKDIFVGSFDISSIKLDDVFVVLENSICGIFKSDIFVEFFDKLCGGLEATDSSFDQVC